MASLLSKTSSRICCDGKKRRRSIFGTSFPLYDQRLADQQKSPRRLRKASVTWSVHDSSNFGWEKDVCELRPQLGRIVHSWKGKFLQEGNEEDIAKYSKRTTKVTAQHNEECKELLRLMGVPVVTVTPPPTPPSPHAPWFVLLP